MPIDHTWNKLETVALLDELDALVLEVAIDPRLGHQNGAVNVEGHYVTGSFALVLFGFQRDDHAVVRGGHEFEAREAVSGDHVADSLCLLKQFHFNCFLKEKRKVATHLDILKVFIGSKHQIGAS